MDKISSCSIKPTVETKKHVTEIVELEDIKSERDVQNPSVISGMFLEGNSDVGENTSTVIMGYRRFNNEESEDDVQKQIANVPETIILPTEQKDKSDIIETEIAIQKESIKSNTILLDTLSANKKSFTSFKDKPETEKQITKNEISKIGDLTNTPAIDNKLEVNQENEIEIDDFSDNAVSVDIIKTASHISLADKVSKSDDSQVAHNVLTGNFSFNNLAKKSKTSAELDDKPIEWLIELDECPLEEACDQVCEEEEVNNSALLSNAFESISNVEGITASGKTLAMLTIGSKSENEPQLEAFKVKAADDLVEIVLEKLMKNLFIDFLPVKAKIYVPKQVLPISPKLKLPPVEPNTLYLSHKEIKQSIRDYIESNRQEIVLNLKTPFKNNSRAILFSLLFGDKDGIKDNYLVTPRQKLQFVNKQAMKAVLKANKVGDESGSVLELVSDFVNEALEEQRMFGSKGEPFDWQTNCKIKKNKFGDSEGVKRHVKTEVLRKVVD